MIVNLSTGNCVGSEQREHSREPHSILDFRPARSPTTSAGIKGIRDLGVDAPTREQADMKRNPSGSSGEQGKELGVLFLKEVRQTADAQKLLTDGYGVLA